MSRALGALGLTTSIAGIVTLTRRSLEAAGGIGELAQQLGVGTKALQALQFAATQGGVSAEELNTSLAMLTNKIGEANTGGKEAQKTFTQLGVSFKNANGTSRDTESVLKDVMTALQGTEDAAKQASAAKDLFGRSGQRLLPILTGNNQSLADFITLAEAAGVVLTDEMIAKADEAADKWAAFDLSIEKLAQTVATEFAPAISDAIDRLNRLIQLQPSMDDFAKSLNTTFSLMKLVPGFGGMIGSAETIRNELLGGGAAAGGGVFPGRSGGSLPNPGTGTLTGGGTLLPTVDPDEPGKLRGLDPFTGWEQMATAATDKWVENIESLNDAVIELKEKELAAEFDEWTEAHEREKRALQELTGLFGDLTGSISSAASGFQSWKDAGLDALTTVFDFLFAELQKLETFGGEGGGLFGDGGLLEGIFSIFSSIAGAAGGIGSGSVVGGPGFGTARAAGGPVAAGRMYTVGEEGPELFMPGSSGRIIPNGGMGGDTYVINIAGDADRSKIEQVLREHIPSIVQASSNATMRKAGRMVGGTSSWARHA